MDSLQISSVWQGIDKASFFRDVDALARLPDNLKACIEARDYPVLQQNTQLGEVPLSVEQQVSDDVAFIAAFAEGADFVSAATTEISADRVRILIAANEGVKDIVKAEIGSLLDTLQNCARKGISRQECTEQILDIVIRLNKNRIYGRLGSNKHVSLCPRRTTNEVLVSKLQTILKPRSELRPEQNKERQRVLQDLEGFCDAYQRLEGCIDNETVAIKQVLLQATSLVGSRAAFKQRLERCGLPASTLISRSVEQPVKLAKYWQICRNFPTLAREYCAPFSNITFECLAKRASQNICGKKRFVHAEIQILAHHEIARSSLPRWIGASKRACFLCNSLVSAHGLFGVSSAHRQPYSLWNVPDLEAYDHESRSRLSRALEKVFEDVVLELQRLRRITALVWKPNPVQSIVNLAIPAYSTITVEETIFPQSPAPTVDGLATALRLVDLSVGEGKGVDQGLEQLSMCSSDHNHTDSVHSAKQSEHLQKSSFDTEQVSGQAMKSEQTTPEGETTGKPAQVTHSATVEEQADNTIQSGAQVLAEDLAWTSGRVAQNAKEALEKRRRNQKRHSHPLKHDRQPNKGSIQTKVSGELPLNFCKIVNAVCKFLEKMENDIRHSRSEMRSWRAAKSTAKG